MYRPNNMEVFKNTPAWATNWRTGMWAYVFHRISGYALVFYIFLHISIIATSAIMGPETFDAVMEYLHSPLFLILDILLVAAVVYHGLNGIRLILFDFGIGIYHQKQLFWAAIILTVIAVVAAFVLVSPAIFGH